MMTLDTSQHFMEMFRELDRKLNQTDTDNTLRDHLLDVLENHRSHYEGISHQIGFLGEAYYYADVPDTRKTLMRQCRNNIRRVISIIRENGKNSFWDERLQGYLIEHEMYCSDKTMPVWYLDVDGEGECCFNDYDEVDTWLSEWAADGIYEEARKSAMTGREYGRLKVYGA
ncbi:MAG: hypothetical protein ACPG7F_01705, partial [Aggregatilineales bacterium]|mgnify:CR=1 FL=1